MKQVVLFFGGIFIFLIVLSMGVYLFSPSGAASRSAGSSPATSDAASYTTSGAQRPRVAVVIPTSESSFIDVVTTAQRGSSQAENDMQRGGIKATRDDAICALFMGSFSVENWIGIVKKIDSNSDGKGVIEISLANGIRVETWNNDLSDIGSRTLIEPGTDLFRTASMLKEGQTISFSGSFLPRREGCINESSITLQGKLEDPEFIFRFSGVAYPPVATTSPAPGPTSVSAPDSSQAQGGCLSYNLSADAQGDVQLKGTLESRIFPGRPNYENVAAGDAADNVWVLNLGSPICVAEGPLDPDMGGIHYPPVESGVSTMQLSFKGFNTFDEEYRNLLGKEVIATGGLGHAVHGGDHTPVLFRVTTIRQ